MPVVEALQIHLVSLDPRLQIVEDLRRGVAVGDKGTGQPRSLSLCKYGDGPFRGDQRLVVAGNHEPGLFARGHGHELLRSNRPHRSVRGLVAQGLTRDPVLAIGAVQVAAKHAEGQGIAARVDVEEWLLLHRVALERGNVAERYF